MRNVRVVSLILITIVSATAATPYPAESDPYLETSALTSADDAGLDDQLFDDQQLSDQDGVTDAVKSNDAETDFMFPQDFSGLDSSDLQAFWDEPASPINAKNSENSIYSATTCNAPIDGDSSDGSNPLRARDLSDLFNLRLPDLEKKPSCPNPASQSPQPPKAQPEWDLSPVIDPVNVLRCPRESDGIQPIALCCYEEDSGKLGNRIAVARECYTCGLGIYP